MAKESVEVELKAKAGNLQQTLEKMQKTLDKLSSGKHEMKIGTNANDIIKALGNIDKKINSLSKNTNLKVTVGAGDTFAKLKNIDDKIKSINKNSKVNITASTGGTLNSAVAQADKLNKALSGVKSKSFSVKLNGADEAITKLKKIRSLLNSVKSKTIKINMNMSAKGASSTRAVKTSTPSVKGAEAKEQYRTLSSEAKSFALQAEKAWTMGDTGAFKSYRESFRLAMKDLADFKKSLGDMSIGKERNIYANMARSIKQNTPLYDDVVKKVKELNAEQKVFNAQTKLASASRESTARISPSTMFAGLQTNAISAASKYNLATAGSPEATKAKQDYEAALNALIRFKQAQGSVSYSTMGATYKSIAPKVAKDSAAYKLLQTRIDETKRATRELNGTQINTKASSAGVMTLSERLQYFIRFLGRASKGVGSAGEATSEALGKLGSAGGNLGKAAAGATAVVAAFAAIGAGVYLAIQSVMQIIAVLRVFGNVLMTVLEPGYEVFASTTRGVLSLSAALQTMGRINGQNVQPFQAMSAAINLTNQAMYKAQASAFSYKEVLDALAGTLPLVLGKGGTAQQALDMSTGVASVAKMIGLGPNQVLQETRDLLEGTITARTSQVARALGITNEDVAQFKDNTDELFNYLQSRFDAYKTVMEQYTNTLPGAIEQMQETMGIAGSTIIDNFAPGITALVQYITSLTGVWKDSAGVAVDSYGRVTDAVGNVYESMEDANAAGVTFDETTTKFEPSQGLNDFIDMLQDIAEFLLECADEVYNWAEANGYIDDQKPIFESLGALIKMCLAYVVDTSLAVADMGAAFILWGRRIYNVALNPLIGWLKMVSSAIADITQGLYSAGKAFVAFASGDTKSMDNILAESEAYSKNQEAYQNKVSDDIINRALNPDKPIFSDSESGYEGYRYKSRLTDKYNQAKSQGKYKSLDEWANDAQKYGINPNDIRGIQRADGKETKKAAKEALQEAKRHYQEMKEELKGSLDDIKDKLKREIDHVDALFSQGFLTVEDYYKQKNELDAKQANADIDYYNKLIELTKQTPYEHETDRQKELLKLGRELEKATAKLGDIADNQKYLVDVTEQSIAMAGQYGTTGADGKPVNGQTVLADSMGPSAIAKAISEGLNSALPPEWIYGQMGFETGGFTSSLVKEGHHNYGGFKVTNDSQKKAFMSPEGDYYRHFDTDKEYIEYAIKNFKAYAEDGVLLSKGIAEMVQSFKRGGYFGSADISGYIGGTERYSKEYNANNAATYVTNAVSQVGNAIDSALTDGFNAWSGQTMDNARVGCVEAVRKIGSWYSDFLAKETTDYVPTLISDAVKSGIPHIPFDESKLDVGDVVVYDTDEHVLIYRGNGKTVGNSSNALGRSGPGMVKEQQLYQGQTPTSILKTGASGIPSTFTGASTKAQAKIKGDLEKQQDDLLKLNQEYFGLMSLGLEQEIEGIKIAYGRKLEQARQKIANTTDERLKKLSDVS